MLISVVVNVVLDSQAPAKHTVGVSSILKINSFNFFPLFFLRIGFEVEEELSHCNNCWITATTMAWRKKAKKNL